MRQQIAVVSHVSPRAARQPLLADHAVAALSALGQSTRLQIFRLLMHSEPDGLPAGAIADRIGAAHNTLSAHLGILARAGLVRGARDGRSIIYRANIEEMKALISFLVSDCCEGNSDLCDFRAALKALGCCAPARKRKRK